MFEQLEHTMPSARSLRSSHPSERRQERLHAVEGRLRLCRWSAALSLCVAVGAWSLGNVGQSDSAGSLAVFSLAMVVCLIATGAGALLEDERGRLRR